MATAERLTKQFATAAEAAEIIGVSHAQVTRYVEKKLLPHARVGQVILIPRAAIAKFRRPPRGNPNLVAKKKKPRKRKKAAKK